MMNLQSVLKLKSSVVFETTTDKVLLFDKESEKDLVLKIERLSWVKDLDGSKNLTELLSAIVTREKALPLHEVLTFLTLLGQLGMLEGLDDSLKSLDSKLEAPTGEGNKLNHTLSPGAVSQTLANTHFFESFPREALECIATKSILSHIAAGTYVVHQGDEAHEFFAVLQGQVSVYVKSPRGVRSRVCVFREGAVFGENSLKPGGKRGADVFAKTELQVLSIPALLFEECLKSFTSVEERARLEERIYLSQYLASTPLFSSLPTEALSLFVQAGEVLRFKKDEPIFKQGDLGHDFYLVVRGKVSVLKDQNAPIVLGQGDCFGEIALFKGVPRTATTKCFEDSILMRLGANDFWQILFSNLRVALMLEEVASKRYEGDILTLT